MKAFWLSKARITLGKRQLKAGFLLGLFLSVISSHPHAEAACLSVSDDPQTSEKLGIGWRTTARNAGGIGALFGGATLATSMGVVYSMGALPATSIPSSAAGSMVAAYSAGCGAVIVGTAGVVLLVGGGLVYLGAEYSRGQRLEAADRIVSSFYILQNQSGQLSQRQLDAFESWAGDIAWEVYDDSGRTLFPSDREVARVVRKLNEENRLCQGGKIFSLGRVERLVKDQILRNR